MVTALSIGLVPRVFHFAKEHPMRRFVAASIAMIAVGVAWGMAAERSDHRSYPTTVHRRPTSEDEERAGIIAKEQRIKKALDELVAAIAAEKEGLIRLKRAEALRKIIEILPEDYETAVSNHAKLRGARVAAEERLKWMVGQDDGITEPKKK
jgi:hypothetical protein